MISLIGRGLNKVAFNAAMTLNKRDKEEIYMFGARVGTTLLAEIFIVKVLFSIF